MADDATDSAFGIIMFFLILGLIAYAAGTSGATSGSTTKTTTPTYTTTPAPPNQPAQTDTSNIPTGPLSRCSGKVIASKTNTTSNGSVNVKIYFSAVHNDRNCVVVTRRDWPGRMQGRMTARIWFSDYGGRAWPESAERTIAPHVTRVTGVYLDDTYNRCVSASGSYAPYSGMSRVTVRVDNVGCN
jgi:hypothetical protein